PQDGRLRRLPLSGVTGRGRRGPYRSGLLAGAAPPSDRRGGRPDRARRRSGGRAPVADLSRGARLPRAHRQRMTATAIDARGLGKDFGAIRALGGLDLEVRQAEFFGLLGPNGAGKTTTVHLLATLLRPTRGTARVRGSDRVGAGARHRARPAARAPGALSGRAHRRARPAFPSLVVGADPPAALGLRTHRLSHYPLRRGGRAVRPRRGARSRLARGARDAGRAQ